MNVKTAREASTDGFMCSNKKASLFTLADALQSIQYSFITCTPKTHAVVNRRADNQWALSPMDIYGWNRLYIESGPLARWHHLNQRAGIAVPQETGWRSALRVSSLSGRYYFHSAYPTDAVDAVFLGPDTYRFTRAVEARLPHLSGIRRALDIGCGAGTAAISIAHAFPLAEVMASDMNPAALALTEVNAELAGTCNVVPCLSDLYQAIHGNFDLIVANPPYLKDKEKRSYRHGGGEFGETVSVAIVAGALERLDDGGTFLLYTGSAIVNGDDMLLKTLRPLLANSGMRWTYEELDPDVFGEELEDESYSQVDRIAVVWLTVTKPDKKLRIVKKGNRNA